GSPITSYTVNAYAGTTLAQFKTVGASTTSTEVTGLTNGAGYTFGVLATNAIGSGPESQPSDAVTPRGTPR
ncbi:MAG: fibronectin type III domain-containing protein, partial [Chloroflexota bacterium]|nr:fibronectin type III domain-containing protein [Chloroflexota bacterium]